MPEYSAVVNVILEIVSKPVPLEDVLDKEDSFAQAFIKNLQSFLAKHIDERSFRINGWEVLTDKPAENEQTGIRKGTVFIREGISDN